MDEQGSKVSITTLGDTTHMAFLTTGILPRGHAQPDRDLTGMIKLLATTDGTDRGSGGEITDARYCQQKPAQRAIRRYFLQLLIQLIQSLRQVIKVLFR
ncbi:MAG: hypothetical protein ABJ004_15295 [Cyclobacteriaceae bacterium]